MRTLIKYAPSGVKEKMSREISGHCAGLALPDEANPRRLTPRTFEFLRAGVKSVTNVFNWTFRSPLDEGVFLLITGQGSNP